MSNNMSWELRLPVACKSVNLIYYQKHIKYSKRETHIGKTTWDNIVGIKWTDTKE